jgi:hypothetical protein
MHLHSPNDRVSNCASDVEAIDSRRINFGILYGNGKLKLSEVLAVTLPASALLTTVECFSVIAVTCSAPILTDSCKAVSTSASSITFSWSPASSTTGVTYNLLNGTTVIASTATTTVTIGSLTAGAYYVYSLIAYTNGSNSTSSAVSCYCWTGE